MNRVFNVEQASVLAEVMVNVYDDLVKMSDFNELKEIVRDISIEVKGLASAQKRTEQKVEELADAQKRTEEELKTLVVSHKDLKEQVGGLSHTVGFRLEDESYKILPSLLKRDMELEVIGRLKRDYVEIKPNKYVEVNIWGRGRLNGKEYIIIGEAKSQLKKNDVDNFVKYAEVVKEYIKGEQTRLLVTYQPPPHVQRYVQEKGIKFYFSYEF